METKSTIVVDVLIQGAGLGGLTLAIALKKQGLKVLVVERQRGLSEVGAGIWMAPNAMQVFQHLGLDGKISGTGWPIQKVIVKDKKLRELQVSDLKEAAAIFGFETIAIQRQTLQKILFEALSPEDIRFGDEVQSPVQDSRGVHSTLRSGVIVHSQIVIGADGLHSQIRQLVGLESARRYSGTSSFRGIAQATMTLSSANESWELWNGRHRFGFRKSVITSSIGI